MYLDMKSIQWLIFWLVIPLGCSKATTDTEKEIEVHDKNKKPSHASLDGVWTDGSGPNATFRITGNSIYDVEHFTTTQFEINGDSVKFPDPNPEYVYSAKMYKIHEDTMIYEFAGTKTTYWRFRE